MTHGPVIPAGAPDARRLYRSAVGWRLAMEAYQRSLQRLEVAWESRFVITRFGATHVLAAGPKDAQPVILPHGWNTNASGWWPVINGLAGSFRLYAPDTVGQAGWSAPARPSLRGPELGVWLTEVIDALGLADADLVGGSGGAWLILKLAEVAPERIRRAVLLSPAGIVRPRLGFLLRAAAAGMLRPDERTPLRYARLAAPPPLAVDAELVAEGAALVRWHRTQLPPPRLPDRALRRLKAPTLVLVGQHETIFDPAAVLRRARHQIPGLQEVVVVSGAGHNMTTEQPEAVNAQLIAFLTR